MAKLLIELITLILCRLPVKSVVRFSSVSKAWSSLFSGPYFARLHCQQKQQDLQLIVRHGKLYSLDLGSLDCALRVDRLLQDSDFKVKEVLGCSNGMLCLSLSSMSNSTNPLLEQVDNFKYFHKDEFKNDIIVIFNLLTGARRIVPPSPIDFHQKQFYMVRPWKTKASSGYGFGFDASGDDYKLVRICHYAFYLDEFSEDYGVVSEIKVYSMKTNCWSSVDQDISSFFIARTEPVLVDGVLYWIAGTTHDNHNLIVAFDIADGSLRLLPNVYPGDRHYFYCLGLMRGNLCVMCWDSGLKFMKLEVSGDVISWIPLSSFTTKSTNCRAYEFFPKCCNHRKVTFTKNDRAAFLVDVNLGNRGSFVCCDLAKDTIDLWQIKYFISLQPTNSETRNR